MHFCVICKDDSIPDTGLPVKDWIKKGEYYLVYDIAPSLNTEAPGFLLMSKSGEKMTPFDGYETYRSDRFEVVFRICLN